ncbi:hypothetical protein RI367_001467 [Sorochytrium milnesiophthora]
MVWLHIKKNEQSLFLYETSAQCDTATLIDDLAHDLCAHGVFKPFDKHGYSDDELQRFAAEDAKAADSSCDVSGQQKIQEIADDDDVVKRDGREYLRRPDPTGRRCGEAPLEELQNVIKRTVSDARACIAKENVPAKTTLTRAKLQEAFDNIRGAVTIAYPMGLPEYDPVREALEDTEDLAGTSEGKETIDPPAASLWWAGKEITRGKKLADFIGKNEKTTIIAKLQKKGQGPPMREAPLNEAAQKEMMAYYYRKQEEHKKLAENDDDEFVNSAWANPKALKGAFTGVGNVSWKPR